MAITPGTLTVTITEALSIDGNARGWATGKAQTAILVDDVVNRVVTATATEVPLCTFQDALTALGSTGSLLGGFDVAKVRYMRLYNGDADSYVTLIFKNGTGNEDEFSIQLDYGNSLILFADNNAGLAAWTDANTGALSFTDATLDYTSGAQTVTCDASAKIKVGQALDGGDKTSAGSTVATVNTPGAVTSFTMNQNSPESGTNASTTITSAPKQLRQINVVAEAGTVDLDCLIASIA